jgi:putative tryptophan/tyrosine transport system substrate-binding protein
MMMRADVRRRDFITLLSGAAGVWPLAAQAQQPSRIRRIGVMMPSAESDRESQHLVAAFREGLQRLGWAAGHNIQIDTRWGALDADSRQRLARELITL